MGVFSSLRSIRANSKGADVEGTITGIKAWESGDEDGTTTYHEFRVETADGSVFGIRQDPGEHVRLGLGVPLKVDGKHAVIGWDGAFGASKMVTPPKPGVDDARNGLNGARKRWDSVELIVEDRTERSVAFGLGRKRDLEVTVSNQALPPRRAFVKNSVVPVYARHLASATVRVPGWAKASGDVLVDWGAAAVAEPGTYAPDGSLAFGDRGFATGVGSMGTVDDQIAVAAAAPTVVPKMPFGIKVPGMPAAGTALTPADEDPVNWETFVAVERGIIKERIPPADYDTYAQSHGVAAGEWEAAKARWMARVMSDWKVGAKYGEAMS